MSESYWRGRLQSAGFYEGGEREERERESAREREIEKVKEREREREIADVTLLLQLPEQVVAGQKQNFLLYICKIWFHKFCMKYQIYIFDIYFRSNYEFFI
jgi:hypothetical protein